MIARLTDTLALIAIGLLLAITAIVSQLAFPVRPSTDGRLRIAPAVAIHAAGAPAFAEARP